MAPLKNISVLDFSTLLPGPLASLMLAEAGAEVVKIERPDGGDAMRGYAPVANGESLLFAMLNRGKRSLTLDLKSPEAIATLLPLIEKADVLIEQFRPGVMDRLGLGYAALRRCNPRLIYCSITGWGQSGPKATKPGHDLNFVAEAGLLGLTTGRDGVPVPSALLAGDIAGGALPAVINILLALRQRDLTGEGAHIDIAMTENLVGYLPWGLARGLSGTGWPGQGGDLVIGDSPRYQIYRTADDRFLAAAPIEDKFWAEFVAIIGLPDEFADPGAPLEETVAAIAGLIRSRTGAEWEDAFAGREVCCSLVLTLEEAVADAHMGARRVFDRTLTAGGRTIPALPVPIVRPFLSDRINAASPRLSDDTPLSANS
ncbi:CaiB/BaiF CoA transferase family protein [Plastorhodobacter daqingensis]|uniref:CaiB/BaiF CoA transferase family protein n=1 Tax=Plastorhodobacter daqingensis TaxID=1387281 RepID=A0ABW2UN75_9RHOB